MAKAQAGTPDPVVARIDELTSLFRRRLLEDREKARAFDALYTELVETRAAASGEIVLPLVRRLIVLVDRLDTAQLDPARETSELAHSVTAELCEALHAQGVTELEVGDAFDPASQEAAVVPAPVGTPPGTVAAVRRRGWSFQGRVLRPALVEVAGG